MMRPVLFRLYVAGSAPHSQRAISNLQAFCDQRLAAPYEIEIVDLFADPARALADKVILTPTLSIEAEGLKRRIVGDLSDSSSLADLLPSRASRQ